MRLDNENFSAVNTAESKSPRYVVRQYFDSANTDFVEFTSHDDAEISPGATVISNVVRRISGTTQKINPDQGNSTIGNFVYSLVDNDEVTQKIKDKLDAGDGLRYKRVEVYIGFQNLAWSDYMKVLTYIVDRSITYENGMYKINCSDMQRIVRRDIFEPETTNLTRSVTSEQMHVPASLSDLTKFPTVLHDSSYTDRPNEEVSYIRIENEIICHSGLFTHVDDGPSFNVVQRGALNTLSADHNVDLTKATDRRLKITEHIFIAGAAPKVAYQLLTGHVAENLLPYSEDFSASGWSVTGAVVDINVSDGPDNTTTADRLNVDTSIGGHNVRYNSINVTSGSAVTGSVFVKNDGERYATLVLINSFMHAGVTVDLVNGDITSLDYQSTVVVIEYGAIKYNFGYRIYITCIMPSITTIDIMVSGSGGSTPVYSFTIPTYTGVSGEDLFIWGAQLSVTSNLIPYIKTDISPHSKKLLPNNWHLGVSLDLIRMSDFTTYGADKWNQFDDTGRHVRFEGHKKTDGKKMIETQIMFWLAAFMPVYGDGQLGLKPLSPVISDSSYILELNETNIVKYSSLNHDLNSVINKIVVEWNFNYGKDDFTKTSVLVDGDSLSKHGDAPIKSVKLRGVNTASHTDEDLLNYFDSMRDRYSGPPMRLSLDVLPSLNTLEVGDVVNVKHDNIRDFNAASGITLDRAFEVQQVTTDWITGNVKLNLFGSSQKAGELVRSSLSTVVNDLWYTSTGTDLATVLTISGNTVTSSGTLTGADTMTGAIYYYNGNLTIASGVTVSIDNNVQLRIKGSFTINGKIDGAGAGLAGTPGTGTPGDIRHFTNRLGRSGYFGDTDSGGHIHTHAYLTSYINGNTKTTPTTGVVVSMPFHSVVNNSLVLNGLPDDLRGTSGGGGGSAVQEVLGTVGWVVAVTGGAGGNGGAGLLITSRGGGFGAGGNIDTSGNDGLAGFSFTVDNSNSSTKPVGSVQSGSGGGGAPGGVSWLIDGNNTPPSLSIFHTANRGESPIIGTPVKKTSTPGTALYTSISTGFPARNMSRAASRIQYLPPYVVPEEEILHPPVIAEAFLQSLTVTEMDSTASADASSVVFAQNKFIAIPTSGAISWTSQNGVTWLSHTIPSGLYDDLEYGNGVFVAVGGFLSSSDRLSTSPDGITWTAQSPMVNAYSLGWGDNLFISGGKDGSIWTSPDGVTWTSRSTPIGVGYDVMDILHDGLQFVALANNIAVGFKIMTSPDGITWTLKSTVSTGGDTRSISYNQNKYVVVGSFGSWASNSGIFYSSDLLTWNNAVNPAKNILNSVRFDNGIFLAVGKLTSIGLVGIVTSVDGVLWHHPQTQDTMDYSSIAYGDNRFVIVGGYDGTLTLGLTSMKTVIQGV